MRHSQVRGEPHTGRTWPQFALKRGDLNRDFTTSDRTRRGTRANIWIVFSMSVLALSAFAAWVIHGMETGLNRSFRVFGSVWISGWAARHNMNPYAAYPLTWTFPASGSHSVVTDLNLNPPPLLPLFHVLSYFSLSLSVVIWTYASVLLFAATATLLIHEYRRQIQKRQVLWLLLSWPVLHSLWLGQDYAIFVALSVLAWILLERGRYATAGICIGILVATKPLFAFWPALLALSGYGLAAVYAGYSTLIALTIPVLLYGPRIYGEWLRAVSYAPHWMFSFEISIIGLSTRFGYHTIGIFIASALLLGSTILVAYKRPPIREVSGIGISVALLASPLSWFHYLLFVAGPLVRRKWGMVLSFAVAPQFLPVPGILYFISLCAIAAYFVWKTSHTYEDTLANVRPPQR